MRIIPIMLNRVKNVHDQRIITKGFVYLDDIIDIREELIIMIMVIFGLCVISGLTIGHAISKVIR